MAGTIDLSVSGVFTVMGTMSIFTLLLPNQSSKVSFDNPDHIARILTFLSLTRSYLGACTLVYTREQEGKKRKRKESGKGFGWRMETSYRFPPLAGPSHRSRPVHGTQDPPSRLVPGPAIIARIGSHGSGSGSVLSTIFRNPSSGGSLKTSFLLSVIFSIVMGIVPTIIFSSTDS